MYRETHDDDATGFEGSPDWLARFKRRRNLVLRRQTTSRSLPDEAPQVCRDFIERAQNLTETHDINPRNIINIYQVPRYFETEPKSTISARGSREVLLRKNGSSNRRFTATFTITAESKVLRLHLFFSKLKNRPACPPGVMVDVNPTGMWSADIPLEHARQIAFSRKETQLYREPVLYIIDSYDRHVKLADSKRLEGFNVFFLVVPPNMINILQLLDVAVNRSYQEYYRDQYDKYLGKALKDPLLQTKAVNL
ncbi:hypothetical protein PR003_g5671 [Phytophthora rubi]|uniref:HTH CENPB-type domain-containing protein n=1 Tax=Phytophthora rubi TaxID=129364 RepID=A0A6A4FZ23_9STRA|nr:hypothetical protein PR002_g16178 [Phytophthora rubi]KAE9044237.1 hypothetical protein PR001_g5448 [Phytophthora rubi]KAE9349840.1 hypothetical protein PR003_g5671 [Phytophthora rubi]